MPERRNLWLGSNENLGRNDDLSVLSSHVMQANADDAPAPAPAPAAAAAEMGGNFRNSGWPSKEYYSLPFSKCYLSQCYSRGCHTSFFPFSKNGEGGRGMLFLNGGGSNLGDWRMRNEENFVSSTGEE
jgi:hypothetical protein